MKIQILEHLIVELGDIYDDYFEIKKRMAEEVKKSYAMLSVYDKRRGVYICCV
jgi:hypothetical protein